MQIFAIWLNSSTKHVLSKQNFNSGDLLAISCNQYYFGTTAGTVSTSRNDFKINFGDL